MAMNNSLAEVHPELITEWSEKNLPLTPDDITFGSNRKVWWRGACGHEWQTSVKARSNGEKCPICSGTRVIAGINDLATLEPLLVKQWSKKNKIKPTEISIGSHKKVIWRCKKGHEWEAAVKSRTINKTGCPYCSHNKVLAGFNDLATLLPDIAAEWSDRNYPLLPTQVTVFANRKAWWKCKDYLIKVKELSFIEAVETIMENCAVTAPVYETESRSYEEQPLLLPQKSPTSDVVTQYLFGRGIDYEIINECLDKELIIESLPYHNVVFIGYDDKKEAKYAAYRATNKSRIMGDCTGSKKQYSFRLTNENSTKVHLFECAIDLLSFATLAKIDGEDWRKLNLVSLSGVYSPKQEMEKSKVPVTLQKLLEKNPQISRIVLHFDNDIAGRKATKTLEILLKDRYEVVDEPPKSGKDFNDFLCIQLGILKQNERSFER